MKRDAYRLDGLATAAIIGIVAAAVLLAGGLIFIVSKKKSKQANTALQISSENNYGEEASLKKNTPQTETAAIYWEFQGDTWKASGQAPDCPNALDLQPPVDLTKVTAILYPGQTRGGQYKPHGGFRFDKVTDNKVSVKAPMDAQIIRASRYIEQGEVQYLFDAVAPCGILYRFDHLATLSPKLQSLADQLPPAKVDNSVTESINPPVEIKAGEELATVVGFTKTRNTSVDWGVYDLRTKNKAAQNATWAKEHHPELAHYGVCWLDLLTSSDSAKVKSLPAGDPTSGKTSDYCQ